MFPSTIRAESARLDAIKFARLGLTILQAGKTESPVQIARANHAAEEVIKVLSYAGGIGSMNVVVRSPVDPMTVGAGTDSPDDQNALAHYERLQQAFLTSLVHSSGFDATMVDAQPARRHSRFGISSTYIAGEVTPEAYWKPVRQVSFDYGTMAEKKVTAMVVATEDFLRFGPGAVGLLEGALRRAVSVATDAEFFSTLSGTASSISSNGPGKSADVLFDLFRMKAAIETDSASKLHLLMNTDNAKALSTKATADGAVAFPGMTHSGGVLAGIPVHVVDALPSTAVLMVDASAYAADLGSVILEMGSHANIKMWDEGSPDDAEITVNLWQSNSRALKCERLYGWTELRGDSAVALTSVAWSSTESPA